MTSNLLYIVLVALTATFGDRAKIKSLHSEYCACVFDCSDHDVTIGAGPCFDDSFISPPPNSGCSNIVMTQGVPPNAGITGGTYTVCWEGTDDFGGSSSCCIDITILPWDYYFWVGLFTSDPNHSLGSKLLAQTTPTGCIWKSPAKICADGSNSTIIKFVNPFNHDPVSPIPNEDIRFRMANDQFAQNPDKYGEFPLADYSYHGDTVIARYYHPKYVQTESGKNFRSEDILIGEKNSTGGFWGRFPIDIYRAPVVFVHGLFGNEDAFKKIKNTLIYSGYYPKIPGSGTPNPKSQLIYRVNYKGTNSASFFNNRYQVRNGIQAVLEQAWTNNFSAGKAIVIGHSMGGILTRLYLQNSFNNVTYKNDIAKLITINTPHYGSQIANWLWPNNISLIATLSYFFGNGQANGDILAIPNLRVDSYEIQKLLNITQNKQIFKVPSVTIYSNAEPIDLLSGAQAVKFLLPNNLFNGEINDLIVPFSSQKGGIELTPAVIGQWHSGSTDNDQLIMKCIQLIDADPKLTNSFSVNGFPPGMLPPPQNLESEPLINHRENDSLKILFPLENSTFISGDELSITLEGYENYARIGFLIYGNSIAPLAIDTSSIGNILIQIPNFAVGQISILVLGGDSTGWKMNDLISIYILPISPPDSFFVEPASRTVPIGIVNYFTPYGIFGNQQISLSGSNGISISYDTNYLILNNNSSFIGKIVGQTKMYFNYSNLLDSMTIHIYDDPKILTSAFTFSENQICQNSSISFSQASIGIPVSFLWHFPGGFPESSNLADPIVTYPDTGIYTVSLITVFTNGLDSAIWDSLVIVQKAPSIAIPGVDSVKLCKGDSIFLSATQSLNYLWNNGDTSQTTLIKEGGIYSVSTEAPNGCLSFSNTVHITEISLTEPVISYNGSTNLCPGDSILLSATPSKFYSWSTGDTTQNIVVKYPGIYSLTVTDENGCTGMGVPIKIFFADTVYAEIIPSGVAEICFGDSLLLSAAGGNGFIWSTGDSLQSIYVQSSGDYSVTVSGMNGCIGIADPIQVDVHPLPAIDLGPDSIAVLPMYILDAGPVGLFYFWNTGEETQEITISNSGWYSVEVIDVNNCSNTDSIYVSLLTDIEEINEEDILELFPNPNSGRFKLRLNPLFSGAIYYQVFDLFGRNVYKSERRLINNSSENGVDLTGIQPGIYYILFSYQRKIYGKSVSIVAD